MAKRSKKRGAAEDHNDEGQPLEVPEEVAAQHQPEEDLQQPQELPAAVEQQQQQQQQQAESLNNPPVASNPMLDQNPMLSAIPLNLAQAQQLQLPEGLTNLQVAALQQLAGHAPHLQAPDPTQPPPKKKRRSKVKSRLGDDNPNVLVDEETGKVIPIPPKHGTPIKHSRPKRVGGVRKSGLGEEEPNMLMRIHVRRFEGDMEADTYPPGTLHAHPSMTLDALRHKIHSLVPSLPPRALSFFKKIEGDQFQRVDSSSRYTKSLRTVGYDEPGPHDIWVEVDMSEVVKPQPPEENGMAPGIQQGDLSGVPQAHNQLAIVQDPALMSSGVSANYMEDPDRSGGLPDAAPIHHRSINKRSNKKWTEEEVEHLLLGLMKYGTSSWTTIAKTWKFEDRTTVDLKDKWRNLVKNVRDGRVMRGMVLTEEARNRVWRIIHENGIEATPQNQRFQAQLLGPSEEQAAQMQNQQLQAQQIPQQLPDTIPQHQELQSANDPSVVPSGPPVNQQVEGMQMEGHAAV